jgi:hypothetical protein
MPGNPVEKAIKETDLEIAIVRADTRKRRWWAYVREDVLEDWAKDRATKDGNFRLELEKLPREKPPKKKASLLPRLALFGSSALMFVAGISAYDGKLAIALSAAFGAAIFFMASMKPEKPGPEPIVPVVDGMRRNDEALKTLARHYFTKPVDMSAVVHEDNIGRRMVAVWNHDKEPKPLPGSDPEF